MTQAQESTLGDLLRTRRLELGITLEQAAARTRIRRIYIEALEEDRPDTLPGHAYQIGFLRSYARLLELESEPVLGRTPDISPFERQGGESLQAPSPQRKKGRPVAPVVVTGGLVAALCLFAFFQRPTDVGPLVPANPPHARLASASVNPSLDSSPALPSIATGGSNLRLAALGHSRVALSIDNHRPQRYTLETGTVLSWDVEQSAVIRFEVPGLVRVWLDEEPFDLAERPELVLSPSALNRQESER